jgi:hypothetical protein
MTTTKLQIDLSRGLIEVEGDVAFVKEVYNDFKNRVGKPSGGSSAGHPPHGGSVKQDASKADAKPSKTKSAKGKSKGRGKIDYDGKLDKTLDLYGENGKPSLKEYLKGYSAGAFTKKNVVFIQYLLNHVGVEKINVDHIYTCHHEVGRIPTALRQSLYDASHAGLIDFSDSDDIKLAIKGINWLREQEAKKQEAE